MAVLAAAGASATRPNPQSATTDRETITISGKTTPIPPTPKNSDPMNDWNFDPLEISVLVLAGALYWRRARTLARRGRAVPRVRLAAFAAGLLTLFVALESPIDTIGEERLFSMHMLQHLL